MAAKTEFVEGIVQLYRKNSYSEILQQFQNITLNGLQEEKRLLQFILWPVPTLHDLEMLNGFIVSRGITNIYSIGCGTGLLEWLLIQTNKDQGNKYFEEELRPTEQHSTNNDPEEPELSLKLHGIEIDSQWWDSKYAPPKFLPLKFAGEDFYPNEPFGSHADLVMFSYFNSLKAFSDYLKVFQGTYVVIIGPTQKQYCAPNPLDLKNHPDLPGKDWNIILFQRFGLELFDYIAIYSKATEFYF